MYLKDLYFEGTVIQAIIGNNQFCFNRNFINSSESNFAFLLSILYYIKLQAQQIHN